MRTEKEGFDTIIDEGDESPTGGSNFLVSAILHMRRQKRDLQREVLSLKERIRMLEQQNSAFLNLSAERLIKN